LFDPQENSKSKIGLYRAANLNRPMRYRHA
jgi:hypothetical protein